MKNYKVPEIDVTQLMSGIRESLSRRNLAERRLRSSSPITTAKAPASSVPELKLSPPFQTRSDNHYDVNDLLKYHDREFVRNAYRAILKREPDEFGYRNYLEALAEGRHNKIDILALMRSSPEGIQNNVRIDGLGFKAAVRRIGRVPLIGYVFQLITGLFRLPYAAQERRRFESYTLNQQREIAEHFNLLATALQNLERFASDLPSRIEAQSQSLSALVNQKSDQLQLLSAAHGEQLTLQQNKISTHETELARQSAKQFEFAAAQAHLAETQSQLAETLSQQLAQEAANRIKLVERLNQNNESRQTDLQKQALEAKQFALAVQQVRAELTVQQSRVSSLISSVSKDSPDGNLASVFREEEDHLHDSLYALLEDRFRGERNELKQKLRVYLPQLERAGVTSGILDIGCGRGEWLELLKDEGLEATGIDNNRTMIERCEAAGLEVVAANAIEYLGSRPDESLTAITSFHVIEHLEFSVLLNMIDEIIRVLKPGGLVIFETPNPENVLVGSCNFYLDPSHRNPLPRQVMQFLFEARGLKDIEVVLLHPLSEGIIAGDTELTRRFNDIFFGPMDYAIIGHRA